MTIKAAAPCISAQDDDTVRTRQVRNAAGQLIAIAADVACETGHDGNTSYCRTGGSSEWWVCCGCG